MHKKKFSFVSGIDLNVKIFNEIVINNGGNIEYAIMLSIFLIYVQQKNCCSCRKKITPSYVIDSNNSNLWFSSMFSIIINDSIAKKVKVKERIFSSDWIHSK